MTDRDEQIGRKVAELRRLAAVSQTELAEAIDVHQQTIAKIEAGSRPLRLSEAGSMAVALGVPLQAFDVAEDFALQELLVAIRDVRSARAGLDAARRRLVEVAAAVTDAPIPDKTWREVDLLLYSGEGDGNVKHR